MNTMNQPSNKQTLYLAAPRGFCAGVERAIDIVEAALKKYQSPVFVNHEIVHNTFVVENFKQKGVIFTDDLDQVSAGRPYIFSAHGINPRIRKKAQDKKIKTIDATCPLVTKVHWEAEKLHSEGYQLLYIGQKKHQEYLGIKGVAPLQIIENRAEAEQLSETDFHDQKVACLTQTTLSESDTKEIIDGLKQKIPHLRVPGDICYATTNRQSAVKALCQTCDFIIVIGSQKSSNSKKLVSVAKKEGRLAQLFENAESIPEAIFTYQNIGLTSGASVPEKLVKAVIKRIQAHNPNIEINTVKTATESLTFQRPKI